MPVSSSDEELPEADDINDVRNWAIVIYQPPLFVPEVELPAAVPFEHPLPPEMLWRRSFENLLQAPVVFNVPKPVAMQPFEPMVLSKRSWDLAFGSSDFPMLTWREEMPVRPVARALFSEDVADIQPPPTAAPPKARRTRKALAPNPIIETSVIRSNIK